MSTTDRDVDRPDTEGTDAERTDPDRSNADRTDTDRTGADRTDAADPETAAEGGRDEPAADVRALPPSAKLVYLVLEREGRSTRDGIARTSRLCKRTVRHAVGELEDADLVERETSPDDARRLVYELADG